VSSLDHQAGLGGREIQAHETLSGLEKLKPAGTRREGGALGHGKAGL